MRKLIYVGFAFQHHKNIQAGYHNINKYLHYDRVINCQREIDFYNSQNRNIFFRGFRKLYRYILGEGCPLAVIHCIILAIFKRNQIFHFIYAENTYKWLHHFIGRTNEIVCTYHQPAEIIMKYPKWINNIKSVNKIILVTKKDVDFFCKITKKQNVYFIPHGINCDFYVPEPTLTRDSLLMVGNWLRDFDFARTIFDELLNSNSNYRINIVSLKTNHYWFKDNKLINYYSDISDLELRKLYQTARVLFLPLTAYTANNAILEAASSGCDILIATNQKDESYFDDKQILILPMDKGAVLSALEKLLSPNNYHESNDLRNIVLSQYSWQEIAKLTYKLLMYDKI